MRLDGIEIADGFATYYTPLFMRESSMSNPIMNEQLDTPELDSHWNYRVIRRVWEINGETEVQLGIYEVYYRDGKPEMCSVIPDGVHGETLEDLKKDFEYHQLAFTKPTLNYEDIGNETTDTEKPA